jgi:predicted metalloendopeptidase
MTKRKYQSTATAASSSSVGWIFFLLLVGGLIALIIVLASYPYPATSFYRASGGDRREPRRNCTIGEEYDTELDMCAPIINTPIPISHELMDVSIKPCDSFFQHMGKKWIDTHRNENRGFSFIWSKNQKQVHDIITSPKSGPIYNFYRSCVDTLVNRQHQSLDRSQVNHVREHILGALQSHADLPVIFARLTTYGFMAPFTFTVEPHPTRLRMIPLITRGSPLPMDDPLLISIGQTFEQWGSADIPIKGDFIEYVQSARYSKDLVKMGAMLDASPREFWKNYLRELNGYRMEEDLNVANQELWVPDRHFLTSLMRGMNGITLLEWKAYIEYAIYEGTHDFFPHLSSDSFYRMHNPIKSEKRMTRKLRQQRDSVSAADCISLTHRLIPGAIGNIYLTRTTINREQVLLITENVRNSLADIVGETPWLSEKTRTMLTEKIRSIIIRAVSPNYFEQEPFLERLTIDNYLRNLNIVRRYIATRSFELWTSGAPNRDFIQRFGSPITEVNAFYSPVTNTITIFGGILNKPFYDARFSNVALYAIVGMIIGHEIGHSVDNSGRLFNMDGSVERVEPWTVAEVAEFTNQTERLMREYESPFGCSIAEYGRQTIGEDSSDIIGIRAAYRAWIKSERPREPTKQEKQWFFQIFAQAWMEEFDVDALCERAKHDVHAMASFRVDVTLRQMKEFREAFNCKIGDRMVNSDPVIIYGV